MKHKAFTRRERIQLFIIETISTRDHVARYARLLFLTLTSWEWRKLQIALAERMYQERLQANANQKLRSQAYSRICAIYRLFGLHEPTPIQLSHELG